METGKDPKEVILHEIKRGKVAVKEAVRLYLLLEEIEIALVGHSREMGDMYKVIKTIIKKKDDGAIEFDGKKFYWK